MRWEDKRTCLGKSFRGRNHVIGARAVAGAQRRAAARAAVTTVVIAGITPAVCFYASIVRMFLVSREFLLPVRKAGFVAFFAFPTPSVLHKIGGGNLGQFSSLVQKQEEGLDLAHPLLIRHWKG